MRFISALRAKVRFQVKVVYINYLVWKHELAGWPKLCPEPLVRIEQTLDYIIRLVKRSGDLLQNREQIPTEVPQGK